VKSQGKSCEHEILKWLPPRVLSLSQEQCRTESASKATPGAAQGRPEVRGGSPLCVGVENRRVRTSPVMATTASGLNNLIFLIGNNCLSEVVLFSFY